MCSFFFKEIKGSKLADDNFLIFLSIKKFHVTTYKKRPCSNTIKWATFQKISVKQRPFKKKFRKKITAY
jgi:hypothetical protein